LADAHYGAGSYVDDIVIQPHLSAALEEDVELLDAGVRVPVAGLLAGLEGVGREADELHRELVVDDAAAVA
jgi:hypothetical protein